MMQAVVFDMDGVLIESEHLWREVREEFAQSLGKTWSKEDQVATMGRSTADWAKVMVERMQLQLSAGEVAREIIDRLIGKYTVNLPVRPGAVAAVKLSASRYRLGLASGSPTALIDWVLKRTGLAEYFEVVGYGDDTRHGKPHPEIYQKVLARLGVAPSDAVGVEDSGAGILSLHAAGMRIIAAPSPGFTLAPDLSALADSVIDSMEAFNMELVEGVLRDQGPRAHR
jgi:beta-phosphoglucomutase-like phosphatase (HAD superfamily)